MRYAVLSDIHGNLEALTAVLEALKSERIDRYLCLGDVIGYGADPSACIERITQCEAVIVGGNHEFGCIGGMDLGWFNHSAREAVEWSRNKLSSSELNTLRRWPLTTTEGPCTLVHGSLKYPERFEYLTNISQAIDTLAICESLICLVGHTHVPIFVEYNRKKKSVTRFLVDMELLSDITYQDDAESLRYVVNPGSVGQPRDGDPRASFAVVDANINRIFVKRVSYDISTAQEKIRKAGLPGFLADRLETGC